MSKAKRYWTAVDLKESRKTPSLENFLKAKSRLFSKKDNGNHK